MASVRGASFVRATLSRIHCHASIPADNLYDLIWCNGTLEHVESPAETLSLLVEHMAPGGALWLSWAPWWSWQGAHLGGRATDWQHLLQDSDSFLSWIERTHGTEAADAWRYDRAHTWGSINNCTTAAVAVFMAAHPELKVLHHRLSRWHEADLDAHSSRSLLLDQAAEDDLTCKSDDWLVFKSC